MAHPDDNAVDLRALRDLDPRACGRLGGALRAEGVCFVRHGLSPGLVRELKQRTEQLLVRDLAELTAFTSRVPGVPRGFYVDYEGSVPTHRADDPALKNPKTAWQIGDLYNVDPPEHLSPGFAPAARQFYALVRSVADTIRDALAFDLGDATGSLRAMCGADVDGRRFHLMQLMCYPALAVDAASTGDFVRHYTHTDGSLFSMGLFATQPGYEYWRSGTARWRAIATPPGHFSVHAGEPLALITRGLGGRSVPALKHRVMARADVARTHRLSAGLFYHLDKTVPWTDLATGERAVFHGMSIDEGFFYYFARKQAKKHLPINAASYARYRSER